MRRRTAVQALSAFPIVGTLPASGTTKDFTSTNDVEPEPKDMYNLGLYKSQLPKMRAQFHLMDFGLKVEDTEGLSQALTGYSRMIYGQHRHESIGGLATRTLWDIIRPFSDIFFSGENANPDHLLWHTESGSTWPNWFVFQSLCLSRTHGNDIIGWLNEEDLLTPEERYV